jgi:hypothetical protein
MCRGIVIEGHLIPDISKSIVLESGNLYQLIIWIVSNCGIAWNAYIDQHWQLKVGHRDEVFKQWFAEHISKHHVHEVAPKPLPRNIMQNIYQKYGLPPPPHSFNKHYLECANGTDRPRYILADEMDLHDPKEKRSTPSRQDLIRKGETGKLSRYLKREAKITVRSQANSYTYLCRNPVCPSKGTENCFCLK